MWSVFRWGENPGQQDGRCLYRGPDEKRARSEFNNLAVNMKKGAAVRLYQDGRCVDECVKMRPADYDLLGGRKSGMTFSTERRR